MKHSSLPSPVSSPAAAGLSASDYVRLLHPLDSPGKVSFVLIRGRDDVVTRTYCTKSAPFIADCLLEESTYLTLNRFYGPRGAARLAQINALYLDLDVHRPAWRHQSPAHWADLFMAEVDRKGLPRPSVFTSTGRGLAGIWLIDPIPQSARTRWSAAMKCQIGLFRHMGADPSCSDLARVFRVPGTINRKVSKDVRTIDGTLQRYRFDSLADRIFEAAGRPTRAQLSEQRIKKIRTTASSAGTRRGLAPGARFDAVRRDLGKILEFWGGQVPEGRRNTYLHLFATCLTHIGKAEEIEPEVLRIAAVATPELSDREVAGVVTSAESRAHSACSSTPALDGRLHYSGARIAELLEISDDSARTLGLEQVFSEKERARLKALREKERRKVAGAVPRDQWLLENSASRTKPWKAAGMSRTKWYGLGLNKAPRTT